MVVTLDFCTLSVLFQGLSEKLSEQELEFRRRSQEQMDSFTLDINTAYARLRGIEQAVQSELPFIRYGLTLYSFSGYFLVNNGGIEPLHFMMILHS
jgi:hypothetical protein